MQTRSRFSARECSGSKGGEIATLLQVAMMGKLPYTALRDGVFPHPTLAESLNNLFTAMERKQ